MPRDLSATSLRNGGGEHQNRPEDGAENPERKTFLNSLLSVIVPGKAPPATTVGGAGGGHEEAADGGREDGEESGGGIIGHLISNLVSPGSPEAGQSSGKWKAGVLDVEDGGRGGELGWASRAKSEGESEAAGGGGVMSSLISSFFHSSEEGGGADAAAGDDEIEGHRAAEGEETAVAKSEAEGVGKGGSSGGGIIENIVSRLPPSLLEDAAGPTTDEASILIHSIVRD